jgi:excisionase family DNA binding protein
MKNLQVSALPPRILVTDAARRLGVTAPTVWALIAKNDLAGFRLGGRRYVTAASFESYVAGLNAAAGITA